MSVNIKLNTSFTLTKAIFDIACRLDSDDKITHLVTVEGEFRTTGFNSNSHKVSFKVLADDKLTSLLRVALEDYVANQLNSEIELAHYPADDSDYKWSPPKTISPSSDSYLKVSYPRPPCANCANYNPKSVDGVVVFCHVQGDMQKDFSCFSSRGFSRPYLR